MTIENQTVEENAVTQVVGDLAVLVLEKPYEMVNPLIFQVWE